MLRGDEEYEIDRLIDHDFKFGVQWYKVAWKGWSEIYDSTWEPRSELIQNASKLVLAYEKQHGITASEPTRRKTKRGR